MLLAFLKYSSSKTINILVIIWKAHGILFHYQMMVRPPDREEVFSINGDAFYGIFKDFLLWWLHSI